MSASKDRSYDVMIAGHVCLDLIPHFPETGAAELHSIIRPGKLVNVRHCALSTGGPVSNTGIGLKILGMKVCFCTRIGDDTFGRLTQGILEKSGNAVGIHVAEGSESSYTVVLAPPRIDRVFLHNPGANDEFSADDIDADLVAKCRLFHFGYPPLMRRMYSDRGSELQRVFRIAKESGATTSCDMSLPDPESESGRQPWEHILARVLPYVDIFLPSIEEALFMLEPKTFLRMKEEAGGAEIIDQLGLDDYARLADKLLAMGARMTSLKSGHRGIYFKTGHSSLFDGMGAARPGDPIDWSEREVFCPGFSAPNLASATGSGDSSIAGFLAAFLRGLSLEETLRYANIVGWENVQVLDAVSGIKSWEETTDLLGQNIPLNDMHADADGWKWHGDAGVTAGPHDRLLGV
jgi:sugar/nucleoside kinase (ribokinase family)